MGEREKMSIYLCANYPQNVINSPGKMDGYYFERKKERRERGRKRERKRKKKKGEVRPHIPLIQS